WRSASAGAFRLQLLEACQVGGEALDQGLALLPLACEVALMLADLAFEVADALMGLLQVAAAGALDGGCLLLCLLQLLPQGLDAALGEGDLAIDDGNPVITGALDLLGAREGQQQGPVGGRLLAGCRSEERTSELQSRENLV